MAVRWFDEGRIKTTISAEEKKRIVGLLCGKTRSTYKISEKLYVQYIGACWEDDVQILTEERNDSKVRITVLSYTVVPAVFTRRDCLIDLYDAILKGDIAKCKLIESEKLRSLSGA